MDEDYEFQPKTINGTEHAFSPEERAALLNRGEAMGLQLTEGSPIEQMTWHELEVFVKLTLPTAEAGGFTVQRRLLPTAEV
jgi:hypothetical protein